MSLPSYQTSLPFCLQTQLPVYETPHVIHTPQSNEHLNGRVWEKSGTEVFRLSEFVARNYRISTRLQPPYTFVENSLSLDTWQGSHPEGAMSQTLAVLLSCNLSSRNLFLSTFSTPQSLDSGKWNVCSHLLASWKNSLFLFCINPRMCVSVRLSLSPSHYRYRLFFFVINFFNHKFRVTPQIQFAQWFQQGSLMSIWHIKLKAHFQNHFKGEFHWNFWRPHFLLLILLFLDLKDLQKSCFSVSICFWQTC